MSVHDGHRQRMKSRFLEHGLDNFNDVNALELVLFYALPRGDTNPIAHRLLECFGSLSGVMDASVEELCRVEGVGENAAVLLKLLPQMGRRYQMSRASLGGLIDTTEKAGDYLLPRFLGETEECVYLLCLDAKCKVLGCKKVAQGSVNAAMVNVRKIVEYALGCSASGVIMAHNHPSGLAIPSREDGETTLRVQRALESVEILLMDHIVVADDDYVSMADSGFFHPMGK